jgi:guanyl-specific ribonuclease Sa
MRRHIRNPRIWIVALLLFAAWLLWPRTVSPPPVNEAPTATAPVAAPVDPAMPAPRPPVATPGATRTGTLPAFLPDEARDTIALIRRGGPFPHPQDGGIFQNREGLLPERPRGWYREYTVETPGLSHRGARRIVTGGDPPEAWYYTDDHYDSFRAFAVPATEPAP